MTKHINNAYVMNRVNEKRKITNSDAKKNIQSHQTTFRDVLGRAQEKDLTVTKHAQLRLDSRGLSLKNDELSKVSLAMDEAAKKGVKDAVIVVGEKLLVASVANKTIITAAGRGDMKDNIITKIDGAIFI